MQERLYIPEYFARGIVVWNKLYKKYLYDDVRFPIGKLNEDEFTTYKVLYKCETSICVTEEELYYYRVNENSIMGKKFAAKRLDVMEAFEERKAFYKKRKEYDLYNSTVIEYQKKLKRYYVLTKENIENPKKYLKMIKKQLIKNCNEYLKTKRPLKSKLKTFLVSIFPNIYYYIIQKNH